VYGSNAFNMVLLAPLDAVHSGPLLAAVAPSHAITCMAVILATLVAIMGQLYQSESRLRLIEPDAWLVILIVLGALVLVYFGR
jgi:cation:H+ antiporter